MDDTIGGLIRTFDETHLLIAVFAAVFLLVFVGLRALARRRRRSSAAGNVVPMHRKPRRLGSLGPIWLIVLGVALVGLTWFEDGRAPAVQEVLTGRVTHVRDGDTIEVGRRAIRLNGLTCDERGSELGDRASAAMRRLVSGKTVTCRLNGDRTYDREVGRCALESGQDIGAEMISRGLCGRCARYDPRREYVAVQREAGPFQGENPSYCW